MCLRVPRKANTVSILSDEPGLWSPASRGAQGTHGGSAQMRQLQFQCKIVSFRAKKDIFSADRFAESFLIGGWRWPRAGLLTSGPQGPCWPLSTLPSMPPSPAAQPAPGPMQDIRKGGLLVQPPNSTDKEAEVQRGQKGHTVVDWQSQTQEWQSILSGWLPRGWHCLQHCQSSS